jgi:protein-arginine kinase activator protein McsA
MKPTSPTITTHIINLFHDGHSLRHIAEITSSSKSNISNIIHRIQDKEYNHPGRHPHLISSPTCCHLTRKVRVGDINTV